MQRTHPTSFTLPHHSTLINTSRTQEPTMHAWMHRASPVLNPRENALEKQDMHMQTGRYCKITEVEMHAIKTKFSACTGKLELKLFRNAKHASNQPYLSSSLGIDNILRTQEPDLFNIVFLTSSTHSKGTLLSHTPSKNPHGDNMQM